MYFVATFHYSFEVELVLAKLNETGVPLERILVIPLKQDQHRIHQITATSTGGNNILDLPLAVGTAMMLLGVIYGYVLYLGPVLWGLFGLVGGTLLTFGIMYWFNRNVRSKATHRKQGSEVIVMVHCPSGEGWRIEELILDFTPLGFATLDIPDAAQSLGR